MADAVTTQTILDGERLVIQKFTNISDGTGETAVNKIIVANLAPNSFGKACTAVIINKIWATTHGMEVRILWDATTDQFCWMIPQNTNYLMDFSIFGGIQNNAGAGKNGNVAFTTADASAGDMYSIVIECIKVYG
jgi:PHP family Zn ribbon phosphoesterase